MATKLDQAYDRLTRAEAERSAVIADCTQPDMPLVYITRAFEQQTGYTTEDVIGTNCRFLQGPNTDPEDLAAIRQAISQARSLTIDILIPSASEFDSIRGIPSDESHMLGFRQAG